MIPSAKSQARNRLALLAVAVLAIFSVSSFMFPDRASAQLIPDPGDIELPELPKLPEVDPPELPDVDLPDLPDVEVPDLPDVDVPDPDDPVVPDDPEDPGDEPKTDGDDTSNDDKAGGPSGGRDGRGRGARGQRSFVAAAPPSRTTIRRGTPSLALFPDAGVDGGASPDGDRSGAEELLAPLGFPMMLMVAVGAFLALQDHLDRKDPKLALGPIHSREHRLTFD